MYKKIFSVLPFAILAAACYITLSNSWIAPSINKWQAGMMGDNKYFPVLTIFILSLPPLLLLFLAKWLTTRKR